MGAMIKAGLGLTAFTAVLATPAQSAAPEPVPVAAHPLDALTADEIEHAVALLRQAGKVDASTRYGSIALKEPAKADVLAWTPGQPFSRMAEVTALHRKGTWIGVIDLTAGKVIEWRQMPDKQMSFLFEEILGSTEIVKQDEGWREAVAKRGITDFANIVCNPLAVGYVAEPELRSHRLMNVPCFDASGNKDNVFARPVEGLIALVDLTDKKVLKLVDLGVIPLPTDAPRFDRAAQGGGRAALKPIEMAAPKGSNIKIDGGNVSWDQWKFHFRLDRRVGPVLSLIRHQYGSSERPIAYAVSASEMFVPYMDADPTWSFKSYLDAGEYGLGLLASPLAPGIDCPSNAIFLDSTLQNDMGEPVPSNRSICIFERNMGDPLWRHYEYLTGGTPSGRAGVDLVVRAIAVIGNYDYILDYVFNNKGELEVRVGATGIDSVKGVASQDMASPTLAKDTQSGTLIAPGLVGVAHDHFVNFRIDMDVDGSTNSFVVNQLVPNRIPQPSLRRSMWVATPLVMADEGPVTADSHSAFFAVVNPEAKGPLGHSPGYVLLPGHSATSMLSPDDPIQARAAFSGEELWVTAYKPEERYAAGDFANQSAPGEGLPQYVANKEPVVGKDIVLWYTIGFRHVTRTEDWPVMPTLWHSFTLRPANFFARNPGMDAEMTPLPKP
jgi:primary-amine oxidase